MKAKKKCPHCGAIQDASRQVCIDCGQVLPEANEAFTREQELFEQGRYFAYSPLLRRFCWASASLFAIDALLIVLFGGQRNVNSAAISALLCLIPVIAFFSEGTFRFFGYLVHRRRHEPWDCDSFWNTATTAEGRFSVVILLIPLAMAVVFTLLFFLAPELFASRPEPNYDAMIQEIINGQR
ncbi:MAG: hypothetical protein IJ493_13145 [Clostridia bacterium]|nr:hypothetical protein [Clostridia bacterium]